MFERIVSNIVTLRNTGMLSADLPQDPADPIVIKKVVQDHGIDDTEHNSMVREWCKTTVLPQAKHCTKEELEKVFKGLNDPTKYELHCTFNISITNDNNDIKFSNHLTDYGYQKGHVDFSYILFAELMKSETEFWFSKACKTHDDPSGKYNYKKGHPDIVFKTGTGRYFDLSHLNP